MYHYYDVPIRGRSDGLCADRRSVVIMFFYQDIRTIIELMKYVFPVGTTGVASIPTMYYADRNKLILGVKGPPFGCVRSGVSRRAQESGLREDGLASDITIGG